MSKFTRSLLICASLSAPLALTACGDDDATDSNGAGGDGGAHARPKYIGTTRVFGADDTSVGYLFGVDSIDSGKVDLKKAVELKADAIVFGDADPYFFAASVFEPEITRWELSDEGEFVQGPTVSFANEAVGGTYSAAFTPLFSKNKSYFVDETSGQVVVWDPSKVEFIKTITIDTSLPDGTEPLDLTPTMNLAVREDSLLVTVFWNSQASGWTEMGPFSRLVVVDTETDEVVEQQDDERCQSSAPAGATADGAVYFSPWDYHVAARGVYGDDEHGSASCGLRVLGDANEFDAEYEIDLSELVGGRPAGSMKLLDGERALLHVFHEELGDATADNWINDRRWTAGYKWYLWNLGEDEATELPDQTASGEGGEWVEVDGRWLSASPNSEYTETTWTELEDNGATTKRLVVPGFANGLIHVPE